VRCDTVVIGGGMAGILCARNCTRLGLRCVVLESENIGGGVTGNTTAKVTAQHGLIYADLWRKRGAQAAQDYYKLNQRAVDTFTRLAQEIPCDFEPKTAYVYSVTDPNKLEAEAGAYQRFGIPMRFEQRPPLPISTVGALGMRGQGQFNPLAFL